jgi:hypothetical protein
MKLDRQYIRDLILEVIGTGDAVSIANMSDWLPHEPKSYNLPGDETWEYKVEDDVWYTRKNPQFAGESNPQWLSLAGNRYTAAVDKLDMEFPDARSFGIDDVNFQDIDPETDIEIIPDEDELVAAADDDSGGTMGMAAQHRPEGGAPINTEVTDELGNVWHKGGGAWQTVHYTGINWQGDLWDSLIVFSDGHREVAGVYGDPNSTETREVDMPWEEGDDPLMKTTYQDLEDRAMEDVILDEPTSWGEMDSQTSFEPLEEGSTSRWGTLAGILKD